MTRFFSFSNQIEIQLLFHIDYWWTVESKYNCFKCYYILNLMWGQWKNGQWSFGILWRNTTFYMECRVSRYKWEGGKEKGAKKASALIGMDGGLTWQFDRHTHARSMTRNQTQKCILRHIRESGKSSRPKKWFFVCHMIRRYHVFFNWHIYEPIKIYVSYCFISEFKLFLM